MLKAASVVRQRCSNHPHRRAVRLCQRCRTPFCQECALEQDGNGFCARCQDEAAARRLIENPPFHERLERFRRSLRNGLIALAIVGVLAVPVSFLVQYLVRTPISPEDFARIRYAAAGTFETAEGVNVLSTVLGAQVLGATSSQPGHEPKRLIDEYAGEGYGGWRSADASFPQDVVAQTERLVQFEKLIVTQQPTEPPETWAREVELLVSIVAPDGPYTSVGVFTLAQAVDAQRFNFPAVEARWIKLSIRSNFGGPYVSLAEMNAYIVPKGPFARPIESPTAGR